MRTIKWLINELSKFPDEALCHAYEGEVTGIVITGPAPYEQGIIYCSEGNDEDKKTEVFLKKQGEIR
jgi:hypothetical protein